jgi:formamidopyrimidine-DNA glycosylase
VVISFEDGVELAFCDPRRFARVRYLEDVTLKSPLSDLGFDAYTELPEPGPFHTSLTKRRAAIKAVLLDQGFLAGIGNWVADEVLYHAGVHPESLAADLDKEATRSLRESIRMVRGGILICWVSWEACLLYGKPVRLLLVLVLIRLQGLDSSMLCRILASANR